MKKFGLISLFLFCTLAAPAQAFVYEGDGTHELYGTSNEIRLNNGLVILTSFSEDFSKISFLVYGESLQTNYQSPLLGTTPYLSQGQTQSFSYAKGTFTATVVSVQPNQWETRSVITVSSSTSTSFSVSDVSHVLNNRGGDVHSEFFQFTTSIPVTAEIDLCENAAGCANPVRALSNSGVATRHSVEAKLKPSTTYKYKFVGVSADGLSFEDTNGGSWYNLVIPAIPSLTLQNFRLDPYAESVYIQWLKDGEYSFYIEYGVSSVAEFNTRDVKQIIALDDSLNYYVTLAGLKPGTTYKYRIGRLTSSFDYSQTTVQTFTTKASNIEFWGEVEYVSTKSATLSWNTKSLCQGGIIIESSATGRVEMITGVTNMHSGRILDLQPGTKYRYRLSCLEGGVVRAEYPYTVGEWFDFTTTSETTTTQPVAPAPTTETPAPAPTTSVPSGERETVLAREESRFVSTDRQLVNSVRGKILLQVEEKGEAWYLNPADDLRYYLGRPADAFSVMRRAGLGVSNADLAKIPVGVKQGYTGVDSDQDLLPDAMEQALGMNPLSDDQDGDGYLDAVELQSMYSPFGTGKWPVDRALVDRLRGKILLQVEGKGEAWYVNPADGLRYYLGRPEDAYMVMRLLSLGISNENLGKIQVEQ